jgi:hypothetical protein
MPSKLFQAGLLDGRGAIVTARDNWLGPWPPGGLTDETGRPLAEERGPEA